MAARSNLVGPPYPSPERDDSGSHRAEPPGLGRDVSADFAGLSHAGCVQAAAVYDYAEALCRATGASLGNVLRATYFVSDVRDFPGVAMAWSARFGNRPHPFVCIQTPPAMPAPGMALIADFWISALS